MSGRPEVLFPLFGDLRRLPGVGPKTAEHLARLSIQVPKDLLFLLPSAVVDRRIRASVEEVVVPSTVSVRIEVLAHRPPRTNTGPYRIDVSDGRTAFQLVFFRAKTAWLNGVLPEGGKKIVSGRLERFEGLLQMTHPDFILDAEKADELPEFEPVYPLTQGVTQKAMYKAVRGALELAPDLGEWIDPGLLAKENWPDWHAALMQAHTPASSADVLDTNACRARLAYDEVFAHQITLAIARANRRKAPGRSTRGTGVLQGKVHQSLPFELTGAQHRAIAEISGDLSAPTRMNRLLQGDVGSGKTIVALLAMLVAVEDGGQGALMAPTEVLARQHHASLAAMLADSDVRIDILTGRDTGKARSQKLEALSKGAIDILVGTHSLFQKDIDFSDLRIAVIDEQHRFGVSERLALGRKGDRVDVLVMTATPIPRSLSLASYGDMDVSVLDEKPEGRKPITTSMISQSRIPEVVERLKHAFRDGRQAYWVCPLVEESEVTDLTAAEERFKMLRAEFGEAGVRMVHGRMTPEEKDAAMSAFKSGEAALLVATTVIEVGVDVANASIMVIERAERFGLAQLHQLRGRVGRGRDASSCLLLYRSPLGETARRRLETIRDTEDGFRIAEVDLEIRGAGDVLGTAQAGLPQFKIADLERQSGLMKIAQRDARRLIEQDPELTAPRGQAARVLLWLLEQDKAIRLLSVG